MRPVKAMFAVLTWAVVFLILPVVSISASDWDSQDLPPQSSPLNDVWGSSAGNVFAVGEADTILRYDGISWSKMNTGLSNPVSLNGVWGSSADNVFVVGDTGTILRYDGSSWSLVNTGISSETDLFDTWGSSAGNVFAVGEADTILRYDGISWSKMNTGLSNPVSLNGVWGSSADNVFVVGHAKTILRYDGISWSKMNTGLGGDISFYGVWGSAANDVFAVGRDWGQASVVVLHFDGSSWKKTNTAIPSETILFGIWGSSPNDVFVVGDSGVIFHYNGTSWKNMNTGLSGAVTLNGVWGSSESAVFSVGDPATILHYKGPSEPCDINFTSDSALFTNKYFSQFDFDVRAEFIGYGNETGNWRRYKATHRTVYQDVNCLAVQYSESEGNNLTLYLAQDESEDVRCLRVFGYDADIGGDIDVDYSDCPVLVVPQAPYVGQKWVGVDQAAYEITSVDSSVAQMSTGLGPYSNCLEVKWQDGNDVDYQYWSPTGTMVKELLDEGGGSGGHELSEIVHIGDMNGDGKVDLTDAILGLQVIAGYSPPFSMDVSVEIDGDGRVGSNDVCYLFQRISGGRGEEDVGGIVSLTETTVDIDLPGLEHETHKTVSISESEIDETGISEVETPSDFYSFVYVIDENDNILGMSYVLPGSSQLEINIDTTAKGVVMSIPVDWGKYELLIEDVLEMIGNSSRYPELKQHVDDIMKTDASELISDAHPGMWEVAIQIIDEIIASSMQSMHITEAITDSSSEFLAPPYIEDVEGPMVLVKNKRSVPYGISSVKYAEGQYDFTGYVGISKKPYWVPGKVWVDHLFHLFGGKDIYVDYELGPGNYITCLAKFPFSPSRQAVMQEIMDAAVGLETQYVPFNILNSYLAGKNFSPLVVTRLDSLTKGSVAYLLRATFIGVHFIPGYEALSIAGEILVELANTGELGLLSLPKSIFKEKSTWKTLGDGLQFVAETSKDAHSYARTLAKSLYGDARRIAGITRGASKLSKICHIMGNIALVGDIADALLFVTETEWGEDSICYQIEQNALGTATITEFTDADDDDIPDEHDNCPNTYNLYQRDFDSDGIGNACDLDSDGDGYEGKMGADEDCDDSDPDTHPEATEACNDEIDNDCDGNMDCEDSDCLVNPVCQDPPVLSVDVAYLDFGTGTSEKSFQVTNTGEGMLTWNISETETWIQCSSEDGNTTGSGAYSGSGDEAVTVTITRAGLDEGTYESDIAIGSNGGFASVHVTLTVEPGPTCTDGDSDSYFAENGCGTTVDCDDTDEEVHPGATEICSDGKDNDCDEKVDCADPDCAGYPTCLTAGLISYHPFDGDALDHAQDHDGDPYNITYPEGQIGQAAYFSGDGSYIEIPDREQGGNLDGLIEMTIALWIKPSVDLNSDINRREFLTKGLQEFQALLL